jgi:hypothetical protein
MKKIQWKKTSEQLPLLKQFVLAYYKQLDGSNLGHFLHLHRMEVPVNQENYWYNSDFLSFPSPDYWITYDDIKQSLPNDCL